MMVLVSQLLLSGLAFDPVSRMTVFPSDPVINNQGEFVVQIDKQHECFFRSMSEQDWKHVGREFDAWQRKAAKKKGDFASPIIKSHIERCRQ